MTVLVLGATGFVGRRLVDALLEAGEEVRAASRRPAGPAGQGAQHVVADLRDAKTLPGALEGISCIYYLVHSMGEGNPDFRAVERECAHNLVKAAEASGCRRIVYLGGVAPASRTHASQHLASRLEVGEILRAGRVETVELRASMIIGPGSVSWQIVRDLGLRLPLMILPKWVESRSRPVALGDVVAALLDARHVEVSGSTWFDIPGPEVMSAREILRRVARLRGRHVAMVRVPFLTPRLSALWLKLVTGADYPIARELVLGLVGDLLPRDARYWQLTGHVDLQSFDDAASQALEAEHHPRSPTPSPGSRLQSSNARTRIREATNVD